VAGGPCHMLGAAAAAAGPGSEHRRMPPLPVMQARQGADCNSTHAPTQSVAVASAPGGRLRRRNGERG